MTAIHYTDTGLATACGLTRDDIQDIDPDWIIRTYWASYWTDVTCPDCQEALDAIMADQDGQDIHSAPSADIVLAVGLDPTLRSKSTPGPYTWDDVANARAARVLELRRRGQ